MSKSTLEHTIETPVVSSYSMTKEDFKLRMSRRRVLSTIGEEHKNIKVTSVVEARKDGTMIEDKFGNQIAIVTFDAMTPWHGQEAMQVAKETEDYVAAENRGRLTANVIIGKAYLPTKGQYVNLTLRQREDDGALFVQSITPPPAATNKFMSFDDL